MSWEAWGSGEDFLAPEGYVSEDLYDEELQCSHEARVLLAKAVSELNRPGSDCTSIVLAAELEGWLDANTPKLIQRETWHAALARQVEERKP